jgi:hypothetical protein
MQGGDKDRRLFYIWIHVGMVPEGVGMQKQYVQRFSRSELDKLDKSAGVSQLSFSATFVSICMTYRHSRPYPPQLPPDFFVEVGLKGSPTITDTYVVHPELILEYEFPRVLAFLSVASHVAPFCFLFILSGINVSLDTLMFDCHHAG